MAVVNMQNPGDSLVAELQTALASATHLKDTDRAAINLALKFAKVIDEQSDSGGEQGAKMMYGPASSLEKILGNLGLTPQGRADLELDEPEDEEDEF